jgi:hypothetical protein
LEARGDVSEGLEGKGDEVVEGARSVSWKQPPSRRGWRERNVMRDWIFGGSGALGLGVKEGWIGRRELLDGDVVSCEGVL